MRKHFLLAPRILFCYNAKEQKNVRSRDLLNRKMGNGVKYLHEFLHQKTPESGTEMPAYYRDALAFNEKLLAFYFAVCFALIGISAHQWDWEPLAFFVVTIACMLNGRRMNARFNSAAYSIISIAWCWWHSVFLGWHYSGHLLLLPVMLLIFFNIYNPPWFKIGACVALFAFRMVLFSWSLNAVPVYTLGHTAGIVAQTVNSITLFAMLAVNAILFSSSIQATERKLRLDNQELHKEAGTDPLTRLPNRRAMIDEIEKFRKTFPTEPFCVAIADIDFFKKVNDTYGHNCGDYTLKTLADLFREKAKTDFSVCRWGGEEFCFFLPGKNIDQAWNVMFDLADAVKKMPLKFDGIEFSITITIGIEENDFRSPMEDILALADKKLYMGKISGRDKVVM